MLCSCRLIKFQLSKEQVIGCGLSEIFITQGNFLELTAQLSTKHFHSVLASTLCAEQFRDVFQVDCMNLWRSRKPQEFPKDSWRKMLCPPCLSTWQKQHSLSLPEIAELQNVHLNHPCSCLFYPLLTLIYGRAITTPDVSARAWIVPIAILYSRLETIAL